MPREYNDGISDSKRRRRNEAEVETDAKEIPQLNEKTNAYLEECLEEKKVLDQNFSVCRRLLDDEIEKILVSGRIPRPEIYANVYNEKPIRVAQKVFFPIKEFPKFNFVGKILGPKGNTLRQLQENTFCKMVVLGRNSMRDHSKEDELRNSKNPKYAHLSRDLHLEISTVAPPSEAFHRVAYALTEVRKFMIPDSNDDIRMEQMHDLDGKHFFKRKEFVDSYKSCTPPPHTYDKSSNPKVYSILEKARFVMEDSSYCTGKTLRSRDHDLYEHYNDYERYPSTPPLQHVKHSSNRTATFETKLHDRSYRRDYSHTTYPGYPTKSNGRSSSSYQSTGPSQSTSHFESGSRSRENMRYRSAPYPKLR